jgi:hypothetical protein
MNTQRHQFSLLPRSRNTKILATLGPATGTREKIETLFRAGADCFRLNFSHGTADEHRARVEAIRAIESQYDQPIAIVADLQGPKLRIGRFGGGAIALQAGQHFRLDRDTALGDGARVQLPHPELIAALKPGADILLDDGRVQLRVTGQGADYLDTMVVSGRSLSDHKGVNVPGITLPLAALTDKDRTDLEAALSFGVDWIALSFVQRPADVEEARALIGGRAGLIVKLEKPQALEHLDALIELADAMMVARGDLGVELPPEDVPVAQRRIVAAMRRAGKPVIVATQMLESMVSAPTPTRAEASDVATAVYEGTDAVMLSAETAAGAYPVEAVEIMDRIARLPPNHECRDPAPGGRGRRRDHRCGQRCGGQDRRGGDRHLHHLRVDHAARRARAAVDADPVPDCAARNGAAADAVLWRAQRGDAGYSYVRADGGARLQHGAVDRICPAGAEAGGHRRRTVRDARQYEYAAYRGGRVDRT